MEASHSHRCGNEGSGGCGLIWSHPDDVAKFEQKDYIAAHMCPRCGKGPWRLKVNPRTISRSKLRDLDACEMGISEFFAAIEATNEQEVAMDEQLVSKIMAAGYTDVCIRWGALLLGRERRREFDERRADSNSHSSMQFNCPACRANLLLIVELFNRE